MMSKLGRFPLSVGGEVARREMEPHGVIRDEGRWCLVGFCRLCRVQRCFRIGSVETLEKPFQPPADFDARAALRAAIAAAPFTWKVRIWVDLPVEAVKAGLPLVRPVLEAVGGGTWLDCGIEDLENFAAQLLGLGCPLIVQHPPELNAAFQAVGMRASRAAGTPFSNDQTG